MQLPQKGYILIIYQAISLLLRTHHHFMQQKIPASLVMVNRMRYKLYRENELMTKNATESCGRVYRINIC